MFGRRPFQSVSVLTGGVFRLFKSLRLQVEVFEFAFFYSMSAGTIPSSIRPVMVSIGPYNVSSIPNMQRFLGKPEFYQLPEVQLI